MKGILSSITTLDFATKILGLSPFIIVSAKLGQIDLGPLYIPVIFGLLVGFAFMDRLRSKFFILLLPLVFFLIFISFGGLLLLDALFRPFYADHDHIDINEDGLWARLLRATTGMWCSWMILLSLKLFFKIKLRYAYFILSALLVSPPYLLNLSATEEVPSTALFYVLWNSGIVFVICLLFTEKNNYSKFMNSLSRSG